MSTHLPRTSRRQGGFQPPFCPNPDCDFHHPHPQWHFVRNGTRRDRLGRRRQKFRCRACQREFSVSTFSTSYWLRKPHLLAQVAAHVTEGNGLRQTARLLGTSHTTVMRHLARLGRHCLLTHAQISFEAPIGEGLVFDGFESFAHSQFSPLHANLAVGKESWFLYLFTISPLRRKGTMTPEQKLKRALLEDQFGRPDPKAVQDGIYALLRPLIPRFSRVPCTLYSDDLGSYRAALRRLRAEVPAFLHKVTSSKARRTLTNNLFSVNLADLLLRHQCANHRRETIAFSKLLQGLIDRLLVFTVWRNYIKKRRENERAAIPETAAMRAGILDRTLTWKEVLRRRHFPGHIRVPLPWEDFYRRKVKTLYATHRQADHRLRYAF